jgi:predicted transcriptional regulator
MNDRTVTISVSSRNASRARFLAATKGEKQGHFIVFEKASELARLLTDNRIGILEAMAGKGRLSIRGVAGLVERDVKAVHTDVRALINAGILDQKDEGVEFPYSAVHVDFTIQPKLARAS